jgi:hypothetical protein
MNYDEKTDSQINVDVHLIVDPEWKDEDIVPNYCNVWNDAGPIIVENRINTSWVDNDAEHWAATSGLWADNLTWDTNPLRASMIVFLKMKDAEQ